MEIIRVNSDDADLHEKIKPAAEAIRNGDLVIFPTETVYGIAARADMPPAIQKIFEAKNRPEGKPFAYHVGSAEMLKKIAGKTSENVSDILNEYLPGPFTFLLDVNGKKTGIRFPTCKIAQVFLEECGCTVMATSANISGEPSPTNIEMTAAVQKFAACVLDAGETEEKGASTVVDLTVEPPVVIRQGSGVFG